MFRSHSLLLLTAFLTVTTAGPLRHNGRILHFPRDVPSYNQSTIPELAAQSSSLSIAAEALSSSSIYTNSLSSAAYPASASSLQSFTQGAEVSTSLQAVPTSLVGHGVATGNPTPVSITSTINSSSSDLAVSTSPSVTLSSPSSSGTGKQIGSVIAVPNSPGNPPFDLASLSGTSTTSFSRQFSLLGTETATTVPASTLTSVIATATVFPTSVISSSRPATAAPSQSSVAASSPGSTAMSGAIIVSPSSIYSGVGPTSGSLPTTSSLSQFFASSPPPSSSPSITLSPSTVTTFVGVSTAQQSDTTSISSLLPSTLSSSSLPTTSQLLPAPLSTGKPASSNVPALQGSNLAMALGYNAIFKALTPDSPCDANNPTQASACVSGQLAKCGNSGRYVLAPCSAGQKCYALPLQAAQGVSVQCDTPEDAQAKLGLAPSSAPTLQSSTPTTDSASKAQLSSATTETTTIVPSTSANAGLAPGGKPSSAASPAVSADSPPPPQQSSPSANLPAISSASTQPPLPFSLTVVSQPTSYPSQQPQASNPSVVPPQEPSPSKTHHASHGGSHPSSSIPAVPGITIVPIQPSGGFTVTETVTATVTTTVR